MIAARTTQRWIVQIVAAAGLAMAPTPARAQPAPAEPPVDGTVVVEKVQGHVWMIGGAGANIAVQVGDEGIIVVDTGAAGLTEKVLAAIRGISVAPIRYVINTSASPQHVGGNAAIVALPGGSLTGATRGVSATIMAHENVLNRMSAPGPDGRSPFPEAAWPLDGYFAPRRGITFNGEAIDIIHMPGAHSDGDSVVYFRGSNVLVAGDVFTTTSLPLVDKTAGGTYAGALKALNNVLDIAIPGDRMEGGTYIVPGHGRICDKADLVEYRDMVSEVGERLKKLIVVDGKTLAEVKAGRPVLGWEGRYGQTPGWTTDMFIEAVYPEFKPKSVPQRTTRQRDDGQ